MTDPRPRVGVVGLGTMGAGIAQVCVEAGFQTVGFDTSASAGDRAAGRIAHFIRRKAEKGLIESSRADEAITRLDVTTDLTDLSTCEFVIEAVFEDLAVKHALFAKLEPIVGSGTLLATNTSALSVTSISAATDKPGRVVGMHFFNPAPLMPLVEVVRGERSTPDAIKAAVTFTSALGKQPVVCNDTPGFIVNRTIIPLLNDCIRILDEARVSAEDLDQALELGAGWPMGPTRLLDLIGLDVHLHASEALFSDLREPRMAPPPRLVRLVEAGNLGRKTGQGFHRYDETKP